MIKILILIIALCLTIPVYAENTGNSGVFEWEKEIREYEDANGNKVSAWVIEAPKEEFLPILFSMHEYGDSVLFSLIKEAQKIDIQDLLTQKEKLLENLTPEQIEEKRALAKEYIKNYLGGKTNWTSKEKQDQLNAFMLQNALKALDEKMAGIILNQISGTNPGIQKEAMRKMFSGVEFETMTELNTLMAGPKIGDSNFSVSVARAGAIAFKDIAKWAKSPLSDEFNVFEKNKKFLDFLITEGLIDKDLNILEDKGSIIFIPSNYVEGARREVETHEVSHLFFKNIPEYTKASQIIFDSLTEDQRACSEELMFVKRYKFTSVEQLRAEFIAHYVSKNFYLRICFNQDFQADMNEDQIVSAEEDYIWKTHNP